MSKTYNFSLSTVRNFGYEKIWTFNTHFYFNEQLYENTKRKDN